MLSSIWMLLPGMLCFSKIIEIWAYSSYCLLDTTTTATKIIFLKKNYKIYLCASSFILHNISFCWLISLCSKLKSIFSNKQQKGDSQILFMKNYKNNSRQLQRSNCNPGCPLPTPCMMWQTDCDICYLVYTPCMI